MSRLKIDNIQTCCIDVNIEASVDESGKKQEDEARSQE